MLCLDPNSVPAMVRLASLHQVRGDGESARTTLAAARTLPASPQDKAEILVRLGELEAAEGHDDRALDCHTEALHFCDHHEKAIQYVEAAARQRGDWATVADMLRRKLEKEQDGKEARELAFSIAEVYVEHLNDCLLYTSDAADD